MKINTFRELDKIKAVENIYNTNKNRKINFLKSKFLILFFVLFLILIVILVFVFTF